MGKKSKKNKEKPAAASPEHKELSKGEKKEVLDTVNQLLEVCSNPVNAAGPKELEEYMKIKALVDKLINLQSVLGTPAVDREKNFPGFIEWLHGNGVETSVVEIKNFPGCGYGLQATKDLKEADPFLTIPRKVMMTTQTARDSVLGPLIGQDKMLQAMPSILLALHLLCEKKIPESFWKPYVDAGSIPHNKKRTKLLPVKSDYDTPKYTRLTMKKYNLVVNDPYTDPEEKARRSARAAKLLRPKSDEVSVPKKNRNPAVNDKRPDFNSYRTVCVYKMEEMWNKAFREHQQKSPACEGKLSCDLEKEEKRGFSSRQNLICTSCSYISDKFSLYEELETGKPGRKPSKLDTAVHVGLSQTPIASSSMRKIILSGNMKAPAASSLQRRANKVLKNIVDVNKMDLRKRKNEIIEINRLRGKEDPNTISVQMDGMYNNPLYSGVGRTPFQPATQTVYTTAENITTDHNILSINIKNKLCSIHSSLEVDPDSGRLHAQCTDECSANIPMVKSIGDEYTWAKECILDLKADNIEVEHLVTDPDSSAYRAAQDLYEEGTTSTQPEHFLDTRHVSENIRKRTKNDKNLLQIMPARTQVERQKLLNCFSVDLTERCNAELAQARKIYNVLPDSYCTPLYFTEDEIKLLKGSPVQSDCYNQLKNIARQYAYFYRLFQNLPTTSKLPIKDCFTFDDYRWAVSTVMTRQNQIPTPDGSKITFGLIPMWDMCNHCNGTITTDYNLESDCSDCFALKEFKQGEQISIFYGARSNAELLVHNGFVYPENDMDRTAIKLGISKSDSLIDKKTKLLTALGLAPSRMFFIYSGEIPVDPHLVSFLRVFNMTEDEISCYDCENMTEEDLEKMGDVNTPINVENEEKLWKFLETRLALLLRAYDTTAEEDTNLLKESGIPDNKLFIIQLRRCEKIILQNAVKFATEKKCDIIQNSKDNIETEYKEENVGT